MTAKALLKERNLLLLLMEQCMSSRADITTIRKSLHRTIHRVDRIYAYAPDTSGIAYQRATVALKQNAEMTFSGDELDKLLPEKLRLSNRQKD